MAQARLLSQQEETRLGQLKRTQPRSAPALDRLLKTVKARVAAAVAREPGVAARLRGARHRLVGVDIGEDKVEAGSARTRHVAEVGFYDYDRNTLVVPIVDLRSGAILRVDERPRVQPPLTVEEVEEAKQLALSKPSFRSAKKTARLQIVTFPAGGVLPASHPSYGHRCFVLYVWAPGKPPRRLGQVIVDLSARRVIPADVEGRPVEPDGARQRDRR